MVQQYVRQQVVYLIDLAPDRNKLRTLVNTTMNIRVRKNTARHIDQLGNYWCLKKGANL